MPFEIIIVDDNSRDGTSELVKQLNSQTKKIRLIERTDEKELSTAVIRGMREAKYLHTIRMDADLSHTVKDLATLVDRYERENALSVIIGSRFLQKSIYIGKPWLNQLSSMVGRTFTKLVFQMPVIDSSNNFRIIPKKIWNDIESSLNSRGNVMFVEEVLQMAKNGVQFIEMPITYKERRLGKSKLQVLQETVKFMKAIPHLFVHKQHAYVTSKSQ
jgi:dolichol-phosphate mannosyltransferase